MAASLDARRPLPASLRAVLEREFATAARRLAQAEGWKLDDRVEGVHEFRRSVKRLRAAVALAAGEVGEREAKAVDKALSAAARRLGALRDAHARLAAAQRLVRLLPRSLRALAMDGWRAAGGAVTEAAAEPGEEAVHRLVKASVAEMESVRARVRDWRLEAMRPRMVLDAAAVAWGRARDRFRASWRGRDAEWLHGARKRAQRCAGMLVLVRSWDARRLRACERRLRRAAGLLGEARDAELMLERLPEPAEAHPLREAVRRLRSTAHRHAQRCLREARREGVAALREGRRAFRRRLREGIRAKG